MECKICFELFDSDSFSPKILIKCGHSFCKICTEKFLNKSFNITCTICRETSRNIKGKDIPLNYGLIQLIEQIKDNKITKNILEKHKYFNDKYFKNISEKIIRNSYPNILNLKKIINEDFIYIEEINNNNKNNYNTNINSIFHRIKRKTNIYNFNKNSLLSYFFNEYSNNIFMFLKASRCQHKFSCMEFLIRKILKFALISLALKFPLKFILNNFFIKILYNDNDNRIKIQIKLFILLIQILVFFFNGIKDIYKCFRNFEIDEYIKYKYKYK
jgi:hypothetical protein